MSVCNLFKDIAADKSSFYVFSEYTDDISQILSNDGQVTVRPSRFICLKANLSNTPRLKSDIQNFYENLSCCFRDQDTTERDYKNYLLGGLLERLVNEDIILATDKVLIKDISILGTGEHDGMSYDEFICYIEPSDKADKIISFESDNKTITNNDAYLKGYHNISEKKTAIKGTYNFKKCTFKESQYTGNFFEFNTIIVLYDVTLGGSDSAKYSNIPLGIYINNPAEGNIKKYYSNDDTYGQGTSYSLRVGMRFAHTTDSANVDTKFTFTNTDAELLALLDKYNLSSDKMIDMTSKFNEYYNDTQSSMLAWSTGTVTGVKGDNETNYRTGKVNITKDNIGLGNVDNTKDTEKPISEPQKEYIADNTFWKKGDGNNSITTKDGQNVSSGSFAVTFGVLNTASGNYSLATGENTETKNGVESAFGKYNRSNKNSESWDDPKNTIFSVGVGNSNTDGRKNAFEITHTGNTYVLGIGGYDGKNMTKDSSKTLKDVIDEKQLKSNICTSWSQSTSDSKYPSEKLVKGNFDSLGERIDNITTIGRFLSGWNCTTGKPDTEPTKKPYTYKTGDYFIVTNVGDTNYKPDGSQYNGGASTVSETEPVKTNDIYKYDGTNWTLMQTATREVAWGNITGSIELQGDLWTTLEDKADKASILWKSGTGSNSITTKDGNNESKGEFAISFGVFNNASKDYSLSTGFHTVANNALESAFGKYNKSNNNSSTWIDSKNTIFSVGIGSGDDSRTNAFEIMQNGDMYVRGLGSYNGTNATASGVKTLKTVIGNKAEKSSLLWTSDTGTNSIINKGSGNNASGEFSIAIGLNASAYGAVAYAEGKDTVAEGDHSHAEGNWTTANGMGSHAEGYATVTNNEAEHAEGKYNVSHTGSTNSEKTMSSIGIGTQDSKKNAFEVMQDGKIYVKDVGGYAGTDISGMTDLATTINSKANTSDLILKKGEGDGTAVLSTEPNSHAYGKASVSIGHKTTTGDENHTSEYEGQYIGYGAFAEGLGSVAISRASHAEGQDNIVNVYSDQAHVEGANNTISGSEVKQSNASHAEGRSNNITDSPAAHAEGLGNTIYSSSYGHAEGYGVIINNCEYAHAEGRGTVVNNYAEHAQGKFNKSNASTIHSIGIGTDSVNRKNAVEVLNTGKVYIDSVGGYNGTNPDIAIDLASTINSKVDKSMTIADIALDGNISAEALLGALLNTNITSNGVTKTLQGWIDAISSVTEDK